MRRETRLFASVIVCTAISGAGESTATIKPLVENNVSTSGSVPTITVHESKLTRDYKARKKGRDEDIRAIVLRKRAMRTIEQNEASAKKAVARIDWCATHLDACGREEYVKHLRQTIAALKSAGEDTTAEERELKRLVKANKGGIQ